MGAGLLCTDGASKRSPAVRTSSNDTKGNRHNHANEGKMHKYLNAEKSEFTDTEV